MPKVGSFNKYEEELKCIVLVMLEVAGLGWGEGGKSLEKSMTVKSREK